MWRIVAGEEYGRVTSPESSTIRETPTREEVGRVMPQICRASIILEGNCVRGVGGKCQAIVKGSR